MKGKKVYSLILATLFGASFLLSGCRGDNILPDPPPENPPTAVTPPDNPPQGGGEENPPENPPQGGDEENPPENPPEGGDDEDPPEENGIVFSGLQNITVRAGERFDYMNGIGATTDSGKDVTSLVTVSGEVNFARAGEYTLTYSVSFGGASAEKTRKVTVTENPLLNVQDPPVYLYESDVAFNIAKGASAEADATTNGSERLALDGDRSTRWESVHGVDLVDYTLDLGAVVAVEDIVIFWEAAYATDYEVQLSEDGTSYSVLQSFHDWEAEMQGGQPAPVTVAANNGTARFVRLHMTKRVGGYGYSVFELQVMGKKGTVIPAEQYPVLFDAKNDRFADWAIGDEQWLLIDFGAEKSFNGMELSWNNWLSPVSYSLTAIDGAGNETAFTLDNGAVKIGGAEASVTARKVRIDMHSRRFYSNAYRINQIGFSLNGVKFSNDVLHGFSVTASSSMEGNPPENALKQDNYSTCWTSAYAKNSQTVTLGNKDYVVNPQTIDLGSVKDVGRIDLFWNDGWGRKGKYYDLQVSENGSDYTTVFRQTHGDCVNQSVYYFGKARYLRILDYQNSEGERFQLEGITVHSQYPAESKVNYNVSLQFPEFEVIQTENGSYVTGDLTFPTSKLLAHLDDSLRGKPVPSNDWWQSLMINDRGHSMYLNPLVATFLSDGLALTNPGDGYYSGDNPGNGRQTINVDVRDLSIGYAGMSQKAEVRVTGYSDYSVSAAVSEREGVDNMSVTLTQGALYAYCFFAEPQKAQLKSNNFVAFYALDGNEVLKSGTYKSDCIVVCVRTHSGYENDRDKGNPKQYEERYYVVNAPADTVFSFDGKVLSVNMTEGNYLSVGAMSSVNTVSEAQAKESVAHGAMNATEAALMHEHGYAFVIGSSCPYSFDGKTSKVTTEYRVQTVAVRNGFSGEAYTAFLPHQYKKSGNSLSDSYVYKTVRGDMRAFAGNSFTTEDTFYGIVPQFVEPNADGYSAIKLYGALMELYENVGGEKAPKDSNLISGDPYWQGKNLHPMALAALAADQLGATDLRDSFLEKIEFVLEDWFNYTPGNEPHDAYFYYDTEWGTLYYKNSEFGANVNLADHHFTYGYFTLAAGVLSAFRPEFAQKYGDMIELMIRDYMNYSHDDEMFPYMRNYDVFAGHGWAGGYADNDGGNNQESAGEALNSWVGAYLYSMAVGDTDIRDAAIYGFTTELGVIKQYWFNYDGDSFGEFYPFGALGQLYGASNFFGTFFNGEPLYMYGIHMIPGGEFLSNYALNDHEREQLKAVLDKMKEEQAGWNFDAANESHREITAWQHIFIPMTAMYDPDAAIAWYDALGGKVGNTSEAFNVYHIIYAMKTLGGRTTDIFATEGMSATVYEKDGVYTAICWNPTAEPVTIVFCDKQGQTVGSAVIPARTLVAVDPTEETLSMDVYTDIGDADVKATVRSEGVTKTQDGLVFENGTAEYKLSFGTKQDYARIILDGSLKNAKLFVDGIEVPLVQAGNGYRSEPVVLTFKHDIRITADEGALVSISYEYATLSKISLQGAQVDASSQNGQNTPEKMIDGDETSRWESQHEHDPEWVVITLDRAETIYQMKILWEAASAQEYKVYFSESDAGEDWTLAYTGNDNRGARTDTIAPNSIMSVKRIKIVGEKRTTNYGYSIYEISLFGLDGETD